ncbi:hypothetical protein MGN70_001281 [Eutypa lata]|nr:hypothetical protein MGN70_001281 [Eutypa lata]
MRPEMLLLHSILLSESLVAARPGQVMPEDSPYTPEWLVTTRENQDLNDVCHVVDSVVGVFKVVPAQYQAKVLAVAATSTLSGAFTYQVCDAISADTSSCKSKALIIGEGVALIGVGVVIYLSMPVTGVAPPVVGKRHALMQEAIEGSLRSRGIEFEEVESTRAIVRRGGGAVDGGDDIVGTKVVVRGLRDEAGNLSDHEFSVGDESNTGTARISFPSLGSDGSLQRRDGGPGFKISYDFYHILSGDFADEEGIRSLSYNLGQDWGSRMDNHHDWANYIATMEFGESFQMALQITPEPDTLDEDFDDPNRCGNVG